MSNDMTCEKLREIGAELALGILPGRERAAAVAHLDRCADCREYVEQLTLVGDGLIGLLPGCEPPVGFETRVAQALTQGTPPRTAGRAPAFRAPGAGLRWPVPAPARLRGGRTRPRRRLRWLGGRNGDRERGGGASRSTGHEADLLQGDLTSAAAPDSRPARCTPTPAPRAGST